MKKQFLVASILVSAVFAFAACQPKAKEGVTNNAADTTKTEMKHDSTSSAAIYECPMKCEGSKSDKPGKCPSCEMELVKIAK
jgi:hypothetical protein